MIKTVVNAFHAVEYVVEQALRQGEATLPGVASHLGLQKSTARNLLRTLEHCGYVRRTRRGMYAPGRDCETLARSSSGYAVLRERALPVMNRLAEATGEAYGLAVLFSGRWYRICGVTGGAAITVNPDIVNEDRCYHAVTARLLLALAPDTDREAFIARHGLPSASEWPEASGSREALMGQLEEIRRVGICEIARDPILAIAVPLIGAEGNLVAALGMYAPAFRSDDNRRAELRRLLIEGAAQIVV